MKEIDPGHDFLLAEYDDEPQCVAQLIFMKREGEGYPGNVGHHPGTNAQEVHRVLIARYKYLQWQAEQMGDVESVAEDQVLINNEQTALVILERRACRRHGIPFNLTTPQLNVIETLPTCEICGHILCKHNGGKLESKQS